MSCVWCDRVFDRGPTWPPRTSSFGNSSPATSNGRSGRGVPITPPALLSRSCLASSHGVNFLTIVRPDTLVRWHRELYRLFWRAKSRPRGRPPIPADLQRLIADMAANHTWAEERIAAELRLKLGITVSPRTVRRYMPRHRPSGGRATQSWTTFLHNHPGAVLACDFCGVVTATFQRLYVFVILEIATLRIPARAPQANAYCERFIGTARRECFDWIIPLNKRRLRHVLTEWIAHYNAERPHSARGPGLPYDAGRRADAIGVSRLDGASSPIRDLAPCTIITRSSARREFLRSTQVPIACRRSRGN